jgi:hypothetical protein
VAYLFYNMAYGTETKQALLPETVHLSEADYDLSIPQKWRDYLQDTE